MDKNTQQIPEESTQTNSAGGSKSLLPEKFRKSPDIIHHAKHIQNNSIGMVEKVRMTEGRMRVKKIHKRQALTHKDSTCLTKYHRLKPNRLRHRYLLPLKTKTTMAKMRATSKHLIREAMLAKIIPCSGKAINDTHNLEVIEVERETRLAEKCMINKK